MKGNKKTPKVPGLMRATLAENVRTLMNHKFKESSNKPMALSKAAGVSLSTVQRILDKETGATLDNIEAIAEVFRLSAYQMLVPLLDVKNPQKVDGPRSDAVSTKRRKFHDPRTRHDSVAG